MLGAPALNRSVWIAARRKARTRIALKQYRRLGREVISLSPEGYAARFVGTLVRPSAGRHFLWSPGALSGTGNPI
jgi:hypothetical protein